MSPIMMRCFQLVMLASCIQGSYGDSSFGFLSNRTKLHGLDLCPGSNAVGPSGDWVWTTGAAPSPSCTSPPVENNAQMCNGDPTSIVLQATQGTPQCLAAKMPDCTFNMHDLYQMDFDLTMNDCKGTWAAPLWVSPHHWEGGGASGEIDMVENCPSDRVASNFAGGGNPVKWDVDPNYFSGHVTLWNTGDIKMKLCNDNEVQGDGSCPGGGEAYYPNIYGSNGCTKGDCVFTFISDIWNGNSGDSGYQGCAHGHPHLDAACGFSIRNIRLQANDGTFPGKCAALTNAAPPSPPSPPSPSPAWQPAQISLMADTSKCLDLVGGDTSNGTPLWLWECNGLSNQAWTFASDSWTIVYQADPSKCIDAGDMSDGKQLQIWDCNGMDQQIWGFDSDMSTIYLANSAGDASKCMDLAGGDTSNGDPIQVWDCNGAWNQQWYPPADGGNAVTLTLQGNTNICLDLAGGDTTDGTEVWVWDCNGQDSQKWIFAADTWQIQYAADTSKCIDAGEMQENSHIQIWDCNGMSQQKWGYDQNSGNVYLADSTTDASLCMDLAYDNEVAGSTVLVYWCNSNPNQQWGIWDASSLNRKATQQLLVA